MSGEFDPELLRPTLTDADDAVGFDRPWNPWSLVTLTFFFGLIAGGGLVAFNFRRLGMPGRFYPALAMVATASLLVAGGMEWALAQGVVQTSDRESARLARWIVRGISCLIIIAIAAPQQRRFRLFQMSGLPGGSLWKPGIAAAVIALGLELGIHFAFRSIFAA
jgi:hypothetical protein